MADDGDYNHFPGIIAALDEALKALIVKAAHDIEAASKAHIRANDQIDTGNMVNGVYTSTSEGNTYPGSASEHLTDSAPAPDDEYTAYVGYAANYSAYQNYGTRYQPARPFVEPAVDDVKPSLDAALDAINTKLASVK